MHVVADRLAELGFGLRHVEHVVDHLEAHAEVLTELGERVERVGRHVAHHAADATRGGHERRGLALDRREVRVDAAVDVEQVLQLEHLTAAQLADRRGQQRGDVGSERRGERGRLREEVVAGEDRHDVRPARVHARNTAARLGLVDHVVVVERAEMHELDRRAAGDRVIGRRCVRAVNRVRGGQAQGRAETLAAGREQVARGLTEESVVGGHGVTQSGFDPLEVLGERCESHLFEEVAGHGGLASASLGAPGPQPSRSSAG